ncbi:hypothetical protein [Pantoea anthophila]|nr:hypothetical protein [Pantoea anthophila]MDQ1210756.1 hypothetical protein [Pantoea anthophila]
MINTIIAACIGHPLRPAPDVLFDATSDARQKKPERLTAVETVTRSGFAC